MSGTMTVNVYRVGEERRRRLQSVEYNTDKCFPYLISINVTDTSVVSASNTNSFSLGESDLFPSCRFWDESIADWDSRGCYVHDIDDTTVTCACSHLTTFQISVEDFVPESNILTIRNLRELTGANLLRYPTV